MELGESFSLQGLQPDYTRYFQEVSPSSSKFLSYIKKHNEILTSSNRHLQHGRENRKITFIIFKKLILNLNNQCN